MKKLFNMRPLLFIAISLCTGIFSTFCFMADKIFMGVFLLSLFLVSSVLFLFLFTDKDNDAIYKRNKILVFLFAFFFILGSVGVSTRLISFKNASLDGHYYFVEGKVLSVSPYDDGVKLIVGKMNVKGNVVKKLHHNAAVYVYGNTDCDIGDIINFSANLKDNPYMFEGRFNGTNLERRIRYKAEILTDDIVIKGKDLTIFERVNLFIRDSLKKGLSQNEFPIAYALLTGNSKLIDSEILSSYRMAGVAHIFAVSGLHIGFLATAVYFLLKKIKIRKYIKAIITTLILLFYSGICGFSASSIRATIMTAVSLFALSFGERYDNISALSFSAIIVLLISPLQLFCVGFQLSFIVVLGISILAVPMANKLSFLPDRLATALGVVLSAQLSSIPVSIFTFGNFSIISVIINILFIPIVSVIFVYLLFSTIIGGLFNIAPVMLFVPGYILKFINILIGIFDYKIFIVTGITLAGSGILYYACLVVAGGMVNLKKKVRCGLSVMFASLFLFISINANLINFYTPYMYISATDSLCFSMVNNCGESTFIISDAKYVYTSYNLNRLKEKTGIERADNLVFMGGYPLDMQVFVTKFCSVFDVDNIYYYGNKNVKQETIINNSFKNIDFTNKYDEENFTLSGIKCFYDHEGKALISRYKNKNMVIFSAEKKGETDYHNMEKNFDFVLALSNADNVLNYFGAEKSYSYKHADFYPYAQGNGILKVKL